MEGDLAVCSAVSRRFHAMANDTKIWYAIENEQLVFKRILIIGEICTVKSLNILFLYIIQSQHNR